MSENFLRNGGEKCLYGQKKKLLEKGSLLRKKGVYVEALDGLKNVVPWKSFHQRDHGEKNFSLLSVLLCTLCGDFPTSHNLVENRNLTTESREREKINDVTM